MHPRYSSPIAERLWSPDARAARMREISDRYAMDAINRGLLTDPLPDSDQLALRNCFLSAPAVDVSLWEVAEKTHGHDIVGFLDAYLDRLPPEVHAYVHYGLTSSDLVEYDLHEAIREHNSELYSALDVMWSELSAYAETYAGTLRAGRTHGQTAEITTLGHQFQVFTETLARLMEGFRWNLPIKSPGPVGHSALREPLAPSVRSTQIIPRDILLGWANDYLRLSNFLESLAMFIRLGSRTEIGEFHEGRAAQRQGSSAMPGKRNPIDCEKVCGLARIVRGYHLAISEVQGSLWEDRDLSNSSTERIAIPGLAATVEHMADTMLQVILELQIEETRIGQNAQHPATRANARQSAIQKQYGVGPIRASEIVREETK